MTPNHNVALLRRVITCLLFLCIASTAHTADLTPYSSKVYPGQNGKLVYVPDQKGNIIPDFSRAGYGGGGVAIPHVPEKEVLWPVAGDNTPQIQAAIDRVGALPLDANGFRGTVFLKAGVYDLHGPLVMASSGVVLRGEGKTIDGTLLVGKRDPAKPAAKEWLDAALILVGGKEHAVLDESSARRITDDIVPVGARSFTVESVKGLHVGDMIMVRRFSTMAWVDSLAVPIEEPPVHNAERVITAIDGRQITIDAPIVIAVEEQYGGGAIIPCEDHRIGHIGIENLYARSEYDGSIRRTKYGNIDRDNYVGEEHCSDEAHWWDFVVMDNVRDSWVRNIVTTHFARNAVIIQSGGKHITVDNCSVSSQVVAITGGRGRRNAFTVNGQLCLVVRCRADRARHAFVQFPQYGCGPNVFLDCVAERPLSTSEPHSTLIAATLFDNVKAPLVLRHAHGRLLTLNSVLWNCEGQFVCQHPATAENYVFGQIGIHATVFNARLIDHSRPNGHIESWDRHIAPRSLYLSQLRDRLGDEAVRNIGYE